MPAKHKASTYRFTEQDKALMRRLAFALAPDGAKPLSHTDVIRVCLRRVEAEKKAEKSAKTGASAANILTALPRSGSARTTCHAVSVARCGTMVRSSGRVVTTRGAPSSDTAHKRGLCRPRFRLRKTATESSPSLPVCSVVLRPSCGVFPAGIHLSPAVHDAAKLVMQKTFG